MNHIERDERQIMEATVAALLASGRAITVNDSEEDTLVDSTDAAAILAAMRTSDEDILFCSLVGTDDGRPRQAGWVRFIYGNNGYDVINDYTTNLESILAPVNALADSLS